MPQKIEISYDMEVLPWSYSKWKCLKNCPLQFYLKYIKKIKGPYVEALETTVGKAAHAVLENIIDGLPFEEAMIKVKSDYEAKLDWVYHLDYGLSEQIKSFQVRFAKFKEAHKVVKVFQEQKIALTSDFTPTTFFSPSCYYRGVIDLSLLLENNDLVIIDHKTGAPAAMGLNNFQGQLDVYKILSYYGISSYKRVATGIHFIRDAAIKIGYNQDSEEVIGTLKNNFIFQNETLIDDWNADGVLKKKRGHYCKYCEYNEPCKAKSYDAYLGAPIHVFRGKRPS
jgi:MoaA/NifB/PqqE/SkfB family radical SAM enzyme